MGRRGRGRRELHEDEPRPEGEDWIEWGAELVFAVDFTPGGAPIGCTDSETRDANYCAEPSAGWARARRAFELAFEVATGTRGAADVGYVRYLGEGLFRNAYVADVHLAWDPHARSGSYVALLPRADASDWAAQHVQREARLLSWLATLELPFRVPRAIAAVPDRYGPALVESRVEGLPSIFAWDAFTVRSPGTSWVSSRQAFTRSS